LLDTYHVDVNVRNKNGGTPVHVAASQAQPEALRILLGHNALVDARAKNGATPLHFAAFKRKAGHLEAARILLDHGADVNARMDSGATPLSLALYNGNTEMAALLRSRTGKESQGTQTRQGRRGSSPGED
jgi:ankyrin repeat protein